MRNIGGLAAPINPVARYGYNDSATIWIRRVLTDEEKALVRSMCRGTVDFHRQGQWVRDKNGKWWKAIYPDARYLQRVQMFQPEARAIRWFERLDEPRLTYAEFALDWLFRSADCRDAASEFIAAHHVKLNHRGQEVFVFKGTRYTGHRGVPNNMANYSEDHNRVTGEAADGLHLDWRVKGASALRRLGIFTLSDLLAVDHSAFWQARLLFFGVDIERLGRRYHNHRRSARRRGPWVVRYGGYAYDHDRRVGGIIKRACASTQGILDQYARRFNVRSCLIPFTANHLVPDEVLM